MVGGTSSLVSWLKLYSCPTITFSLLISTQLSLESGVRCQVSGDKLEVTGVMWKVTSDMCQVTGGRPTCLA